jgi:hypothetical protein
VTGIKGVTSYVWWPFEEPYRFPWEQWNWPEHSRVTIAPVESENVSWTNICWISTNSLAVSFYPSNATTNHAGFSMARFADINGAKSVPFAYIKSYPSGNDIYLYVPGGTTGFTTNIVRNLSWATNWYTRCAITMRNTAAGEVFVAEVVAGDPLKIFLQTSGNFPWTYISGYRNDPSHSDTPTNSLSVLKLWVPSRTNVSPVYVAISVTDGTPVKTNSAFAVGTDLATTDFPNGVASSNAIVANFTATDDKRITTNKLYELREVLTNLYRTVYFRGVGALVASNKITTSYTQYGGTLLSTNITGSTLPIGYYAIGDGSSYIPALIAGATANTVTTNSNADVADVFSEELTYLARNAGYWDYDYPEWQADAYIAGEYSKVEYEYKGVTLEYPSLYAVTNGLVKSVKVYAVYDITALSCPAYASGIVVTNNLVIDGAYWNLSNLGIEIDGNPVNVPSDTPPETRVLSVDRSYSGNNKAVYRKIYEADDPTTEIRFDVAKPAVTPPVYSNKTSYVYYKTFWNANDFSEWFGWEYDLAYTVAFTRFMIVVDWNFKHLGNGFTPQTNTPAWRQ